MAERKVVGLFSVGRNGRHCLHEGEASKAEAERIRKLLNKSVTGGPHKMFLAVAAPVDGVSEATGIDGNPAFSLVNVARKVAQALDGYLNSPEQVALGGELRQAIASEQERLALGSGGRDATLLASTEFSQAKATIMGLPEQAVRGLAIAQFIQLQLHEKYGDTMKNLSAAYRAEQAARGGPSLDGKRPGETADVSDAARLCPGCNVWVRPGDDCLPQYRRPGCIVAGASASAAKE